MYPLALVLTLALALPMSRSFAADRQTALAERMEWGAQDIGALETVALNPDNADYRYHLGLAYDRLMQAPWSSDPARMLVAGVRAMMEYREAILRNPISAYPYLAWGWTLESMSCLAGWIAENRLSSATSDDIGRHSLAYLATQLAQHPEHAAQRSR